MAPQDDLTAERAAFQLIWHISQELGLLKSFTVEDFEREDVYPLCRGHIIKALKTARQEALREARQLVSTMFDQQASELPDYYAALLDVGNALDRLASEGG